MGVVGTDYTQYSVPIMESAKLACSQSDTQTDTKPNTKSNTESNTQPNSKP